MDTFEELLYLQPATPDGLPARRTIALTALMATALRDGAPEAIQRQVVHRHVGQVGDHPHQIHGQHLARQPLGSQTGNLAQSVDDAIFKGLWRWANRRYPNKNRTWIRKKYFGTRGGDNWVFHGRKKDQHSKVVKVWLRDAADTQIRRHVKIQAEANPYDLEWEAYFEKRLSVKIEATLKGRRQLLRLWKEQDGLCPVCEQRITELTGWHNHHIVWRVMGGSDADHNRVLLHPDCHRQVHVKGRSVTKPRPARGVPQA